MQKSFMISHLSMRSDASLYVAGSIRKAGTPAWMMSQVSMLHILRALELSGRTSGKARSRHRLGWGLWRALWLKP